METTGQLQRYQDDGASCHDVQQVIDLCAEKGIERPLRPPISPDIPRMNNVWGWINNKLAALKEKPWTLEKMERVLTELWNAISVESIKISIQRSACKN
jgi:hypothetical protein